MQARLHPRPTRRAVVLFAVAVLVAGGAASLPGKAVPTSTSATSVSAGGAGAGVNSSELASVSTPESVATTGLATTSLAEPTSACLAGSGSSGGSSPPQGIESAASGTNSTSFPNATLSSDGSTNPFESVVEDLEGPSASPSVCPSEIFPPHAPASPAEVSRASASGAVSPLYLGEPAPIGLADYGLSEGPGGAVESSVLRTTSVRGSVDANSTGIRNLDLGSEGPDGFAIQLDAVITDVDLFGQTSAPRGPLEGTPYEFWAQNVVVYYPAEHYMVLETNLWNFSGNVPLIWAIYSHGPRGQILDDDVYVASLPIATPITYPFDLTLFLNSTVADGRQGVEFSVQLSGPGESFSKPYDYVVFNSMPADGAGATTAASFTADGSAYNPVGLPNDFELDLGGTGGGSQADLVAADAQLGLAYWNASARGGRGGYLSVPSAFSFGSETGETAVGANVAWSDAPGGVAGLPTYATVTTGPSILTGLWNASGAEGAFPVTIDATPSNAFEIVTPVGSDLWPNGTPEAAIAPTVTTSTLWLAPGSYRLKTELSGFAPSETSLDVTGPMTIDVRLTSDPGLGIYTPLWAWENSQIAALSTAGAGTPTSPYVIENSEPAALPSTFGLYNDYGYAVYPGVLLLGTTATTEFREPASFLTDTNTTQYTGPVTLPATNSLAFWFDNVSGVALVDGTFGPWSAQPQSSTVGPAAVAFVGSEGNLIAGNTFPGRGVTDLVLWPGGPFFSPANVTGGSNIVWGNTFELGGSSDGQSYTDSLGLALGEPHDLVYNNRFELKEQPTARYSGGIPYGGVDAFEFTSAEYPLSDAQLSSVRWNITPEPASAVNYAPGFPTLPLTGSVVGGSTQGGNSWWDYGLASNPYGTLPFDENLTTPFIPVGGDYAPLLTAPLSPVVLSVSGLHADKAWHLVLTNSSGPLNFSKYSPLDNATVGASSRTIDLPNGTYTYLITGPHGYRWGSGSLAPAGLLTVSGSPLRETLEFVSGHTPTATFREAGLGQGSGDVWCAELEGWAKCARAPTGIRFANLTPEARFGGSYLYSVPPPVPGVTTRVSVGGTKGSANGALTAGHGWTVQVRFTALFAVTFTEQGIPVNFQRWSITIAGKTLSNESGHSIVFELPTGRHTYRVATEAGYKPRGSKSGTVNVHGAPALVIVQFELE